MWDNSPEFSTHFAKSFRQNGEELPRLFLHKVSCAADQLWCHSASITGNGYTKFGNLPF
jgi:hypothetical protein